MTDVKPQEIEFSVPGEASPRHFESPADLLSFLKKDRAAWEPLFSARNTHPQANEVVGGVQDVIDSALSNFPAGVLEPADALNKALAATTTLSNGIRKQRWFPSDTPKGKYLTALAARNAQIAAYALRHLRGLQSDTNQNPSAASGVVAGALFDLEPEGQVRATAEQLAQLTAELRATVSIANDQAGKLVAELNGTIRSSQESAQKALAATEEAAAKSRKEISDLAVSGKSQLEVLLAKGTQNLEAIAATYDKKLALHSAVSYWKSKRLWHRTYGGLLAVVVAGGFIAVGWLFQSNVSAALSVRDVQVAQVANSTLTTNSAPTVDGSSHPTLDPWRLSIAAVYLLLGVWVIRVLVRLFLSQLHLASDASERAVMVESYLALIREGGGLADKDKAMIIEALFRQAGSGIVRDDAAPLSVATAISRAMSGR